MSTNIIFDSSIIAAAMNGLLTGASLDQSIKQLPARHTIGVIAFSEYSMAADLARGVFWYAILGIGAAVITLITAVLVFISSTPISHGLPIYIASFFTVLHSFATTRAAPINFSQREAATEKALVRVFNRFEFWQSFRVFFQCLAFIATLWSLFSY